MNGSIVIGMEAAGRTRQGTYAPAQPCATRDSAQINSKRGIVRNQSRNSAAYQPLRMRAGGSDDRALNRGGIVANVKFLPASFQSAAFRARSVIPAKLLPGGRCTAGSVLPFWRCFRPFILRAVKVARHLFSCLHSALRVLQDFACNGAKSFQVLSLSARVMGLAAGVVGQHTDRRKMKCPTKALKDSTK